MRSSALLLLVFLVGCGEGLPFLGNDDGGADADAGADVVDAAPFVPGPHGPLPQEINASGADGGAGVVSSMNVVPIFFANDALENGIEGLYAQLPSSAYWSALEAEYGVGALTVAKSIVLTESPPSSATQVDVTSFIASKLGTDPAWPAPTPNTLYFIYYPTTTTLSYATFTVCTDFLGYHSYGQKGASKFLFAVQGRCTNGQISQLDDATQNTTHELVEAATDPFLVSYVTQDDAHAVWTLFPGTEIGDLCELEALSYQRMVGLDMVARFWSNSSAAAGHDPCAPAITLPYFNAVPVLPDQVDVTTFTTPILTSGVAIPVGTNKTIDVQLYSDAPVSDWTVEADDGANFAAKPAGELQFLWNKTHGNNGDTLQLTIYRVKNGANGGTEFAIRSYQSTAIWHGYFAWASN